MPKDEKEWAFAEKDRNFADYVFANGWFFKTKLLRGMEGFKAVEICWIYPKKVKQSSVVGTFVLWSIIVETKNKPFVLHSEKSTNTKTELMPADADFWYRKLQSLVPWALFGFSEYLKECWTSHKSLFLSVQNRRLALIRSGLKENQIIIQPDGSLSVSQSFHLPTIGTKFERDQRGKMQRVYYEFVEQKSTPDQNVHPQTPAAPAEEEGERNKGDDLRISGKYEEAIIHYDKAIEINPHYAAAWEFKIECLRNLGRLQEALQCSNKAIEINPNPWEFLCYKGQCLHDLSQLDEAIECYDKALQIDSKNFLVLHIKGISLSSLGRFEEAIRCYDKAIEQCPIVSSFWDSKGIAFHNWGRFKEAIKCFEKALQQNGRDEKAYFGKAVALHNMGKFKEAVDCYNKALELKPQYQDAVTGRLRAIERAPYGKPL